MGMARFEAFRGTSYVPGKVDPDDVIAPPYDVVNAAERSHLAARSPYNAIHVELPEPAGSLDRYASAAALFTQWHSDSAVAVATVPTLYVYRMTFTDESGSARSTTGVLGALGLDPTHSGEVLPHEETTSKDKSDRLSLLRAARTNFSPIWGLSTAAGLAEACSEAAAAIEEAGGSSWRATDEDGVVHETWAVTDAGHLSAIAEAVASGPVLIADGHHRYETACAYLEEQPGSVGATAVLAFVVELVEEQLSVRAIHRLLSGVEPVALPAQLTAHFAVEPAPSDAFELQASLVDKGALGLLTANGNWYLTPSEELVEAAGADLDSSRLAYALDDLGIEDVRFQHGVADVLAAVESGEAAAAVLLRPVSVERIAETARGGRRMPPKSTFFHPKPRTGMAFRELDEA
ncbi:MAG TPA: DUF1015 domain-containing protein [Acidimicrobiales bacterium]|jgi:uncharacterized protein (DUF1015 family)|nr:DUF1015 domain-containing protein [Acidimicrobiales bacterium]